MQYALRITHSYPDLLLHVKICTVFDVKWCHEVKIYELKSCNINEAVYTVHSEKINHYKNPLLNSFVSNFLLWFCKGENLRFTEFDCLFMNDSVHDLTSERSFWPVTEPLWPDIVS